MKNVAIKEDLCMGCGLCKVHCVTNHSKSADIIKAWKEERPKIIPRLKIENNANISTSLRCQQCEEPYCVYFCLTGAMQIDQNLGIVKHDSQKCIGCWTCVLACPHNALFVNKEAKIVVKCDLCCDKGFPACITNCPNEALTLVERTN